jgi:glucokinase
MRVLAIDIGGSSVKRALLNVNVSDVTIVKRFDAIELQKADFQAVEAAVLETIDTGAPLGSGVAVVGISTTGTVNAHGIVLNAGHFSGYTNIDWHSVVRSHQPSIACVVTVNDGRASTWAEYRGRAELTQQFAHVVVGTGIGGATIAHGELVVGDEGFAGYLGHLKVTSEETIRCSCGSYGCVETLASARAITHNFALRSGAMHNDAPAVHFRDVVEAARANNVMAVEALTDAGRWLGTLLSLLMNIDNPRYITLGGGVAVACNSLRRDLDFDPFFDAAVATARAKAHKRVAELTTIVLATHGNDGGLIGAATLAARQAGEALDLLSHAG